MSIQLFNMILRIPVVIKVQLYHLGSGRQRDVLL